MPKFWRVLVILTVSASFAHAGDCTPLDVRDGMTPELQTYFRTPLDQGPIGLCYAYAASDMMSQAVGVPVSAIHTGAYYASHLSPVMRTVRRFFQDSILPEGGFTRIAIEDMQKLGHLCKASRVTSAGVLKITNSRGEEATGKFSYLVTYLEAYRTNSCGDLCSTNLDGLIKAYLPGYDVQTVKNYAKIFADDHIENVLFSLFDKMCEGFEISLEPDQFKIVSVGHDYPRRDTATILKLPGLVESLDRALAKNKIVGLEYDASYVDEKLDFMGKWHASTVVGRTELNGLCYYRVRNSWRKSFRYSAGVISDGNDGTYLVPRFMLKNMAVNIHWLE